VEKSDKKGLLMHILKDKSIETALVFARTKHGSDRIVKDLVKAGIKAEAIHGNKSQNARQRALTNFKAKTTRILVATDIAARGIDVDELTHVINYELPNIPETYVHRIGRTGRAGLSGTALSFCDAEEKEYLDDIEKLIGLKLPVTEDHPYAMSWQSLMSGAAAAKANGKSKPSRGARPDRGPRPEKTERQPNLSGAKKKPYGGNRRWGKKS
jgi:ATP-dependent RNA helicase RhlE